MTLLITGPASVKVVNGSCSILGYELPQRKPVVVRPWRTVPVYSGTNSELEVSLGDEAKVEEVEGSTILEEWVTIANRITAEPCKVVVLGRSDSGKTSFSTLVLNTLASKNQHASFLDVDSGQSTISVPTTIAAARVTKTTHDLNTITPMISRPVGFTSPSYAPRFFIDCISQLYDFAVSGNDRVIVDCDGWMDGTEAETYKSALLNTLRPDCVVVIGDCPRSLHKTCDEIGATVHRCDPSKYASVRGSLARKKIREFLYRKALRNGVLRTAPLSWVKIDTIMREAFGVDMPWGEVFTRCVSALAYSWEKLGFEAERLSSTHDLLTEKGIGLVSYLFDIQNRYSGLGLVFELEESRNLLRIFTPYKGQIKTLVLGNVFVSKFGDEIFPCPPHIIRSQLPSPQPSSESGL